MKTRILTTLLIISVALNGVAVGALVSVYLKGKSQQAHASIGQKPMREFLRQDLSLSKEQVDGLMREIDRNKPRVTELRDRMLSERSEVMRLVSTGSKDEAAIGKRVEELNRAHNELRKVTVGTVVHIMQFLSPEAARKFGDYLKERARICGSRGPGTGKGPFGDLQKGN